MARFERRFHPGELARPEPITAPMLLGLDEADVVGSPS
jgi:hypothetical protein